MPDEFVISGAPPKEQKSIQLNKLVPENFDYIALSYTGSDLTGVTYRDGGSSGRVVATLTLTYSSGVLQTITKA